MTDKGDELLLNKIIAANPDNYADEFPIIEDPHDYGVAGLKPANTDWLVSKKGKLFFYGLYDDVVIRVFESGHVAYAETGQIISSTKSHRITTDNTGYYSGQRRKYKMAEATARALAEVGGGDDIEGIAVIARRLIKITDGGDDKAAIAAAKELRAAYTGGDSGPVEPSKKNIDDVADAIAEKIMQRAMELKAGQ